MERNENGTIKNVLQKERAQVSQAYRIIHNETRKYWNALKLILVFICIVGFLFNSFVIFKQFIENETVVTNTIQESKKLYFPSITLCGFSGFKQIVKDYSELKYESYINNTIEINEMLIEVADHDKRIWRAEPVRDTTFDKSGTWEISTTYSAYRGRCYTINYKRKVLSREAITLQFKEKSNFWMYVHDEGDEFYLHYDFWPKVPFIHHSQENEYFADIVVRKELEVKNEKCQDGNYNYFDCIRRAFKEKVNSQNSMCTTPVIQSMLGEIPYDNSNRSNCNNGKDFFKMFLVGQQFSKNISNYIGSKCKASCKKASYDVAVQPFDKLSFVNVDDETLGSVDEPIRAVLFYYSTTDVKVGTTSKLITLSSFISSIGGNLGLFVGFSFLNVLLLTYKFIKHISFLKKQEIPVSDEILL